MPETQLSTMETVERNLAKHGNRFAQAIPSGLGLDHKRFMRIVVQSVAATPQLLQCSLDSVIGSALTGAMLGLECDGVSNMGAIVPRKVRGSWKAQFQPGYRGLQALAYRSSMVRKIETRLVYLEEDQAGQFEVQYGTEPLIRHSPNMQAQAERDWRKVEWAYGVAWLQGGYTTFEVVNKKEFLKIKETSFSSAWKSDDHIPAMIRKTASIRLCKQLPTLGSSSPMGHAVALDEMAEAGIDQVPERYVTEDLPKAKEDLASVTERMQGRSGKAYRVLDTGELYASNLKCPGCGEVFNGPLSNASCPLCDQGFEVEDAPRDVEILFDDKAEQEEREMSGGE